MQDGAITVRSYQSYDPIPALHKRAFPTPITTFRSREIAEVCFLHQQPQRLFDIFCQRLHELRRFCPVADAVIDRDGSFHAPTRLDLPTIHDRHFVGRTDRQDEGQSLMRAAMSQMNLSARAYHRILKLARAIADLAGSEDIQSAHLAEALQYRPKLMMG